MDQTLLRTAYLDHIARLEREYASVLSAEGLDAVVLHSGSAKRRSDFDDQFWPLRVTPHFQHWLPLAAPDCALVVRPGVRPLLLWWKETNFWEGAPPPTGDHWQESFEIAEVTRLADLQAHLPSGRVGFVGEDTRKATEWGMAISGFSSGTTESSLTKKLDVLRVKKSAYERLCLKEANRRAAIGHARVAEAFRDGDRSELELHLLFLAATGQDDPETPYKNIVALGEHAATLHHIHYDRTRRARPADSLLLDAGATYLGYASDITRTYVKGEGTARAIFAELIARTEAMQQRLCGEAVVGLPYEQLHDRTHQEVGTILSELKLVRGSPEEAVKSGLTRAFFPHGLGHSLGLQCHDVGCAEMRPRPDNPFLRNTTVIADEQVFTVEPGIYFIDLLLRPLREGVNAGRIDWKLVDALAPLGGVRIEDDVAMQEGQARNLTRTVWPS